MARLRLQPIVYRIAMVTGPKRLTRDVRIIHRQVISEGRAMWLGTPFPDRGDKAPPLTDMQRAVARVRALFANDG